MKTKILLAGVLIILKLSFLGCAVGTVATVESGDRATEQSRVLIATQKSEFKQAVLHEIRSILENNSCYIKVIDVKKLPNESTEGYHAVIILMNAWQADRILGWKALLMMQRKKRS